VLPGLATSLILVHLLLVQRLGISVHPNLEEEWIMNPSAKREMKFFPNFLLRELMAWYVAFGSTEGFGRHLPVESGSQGRSVCVSTGRHQARVVFPIHVPDTQDHPAQERRTSLVNFDQYLESPTLSILMKSPSKGE
jgi:hypothetical protein